MEIHAPEAEAAVERKDMKTVYQITRKLRGDRDRTKTSLQKRKTDFPSLRKRQNKRDIENTFSRYDPPTLADVSEAEQDMDIVPGPITVHVVIDALKKLKNGRAPTDDHVCTQMLKAEEQKMPQLLQHILQAIKDD